MNVTVTKQFIKKDFYDNAGNAYSSGISNVGGSGGSSSSASGASISGTPVDNQVAIWTGSTAIEGDANFTWDGSKLDIEGDFRLTRASVDSQYIEMTSTASGHIIDTYGTKGFSLKNEGNLGITIDVSGNVGVYDTTPSYKFDVNGTGRFTGNLYGDSNVQHLSFTQGFQGTNWQVTAAGNAEFRDLLISGSLSVYELIINQIRYQDGGLIIGAGGGKVRTVDTATVGSETLTMEDPEGNGIIPFTVGAIVLLQDFDLNRTTVIKKIVRQVSALNSDGSIDFTTTAGWLTSADTGIYAAGDTIVSIGHVSDINLDASIYMSAVDSGGPFLRVMDEMDSYAKWSLTDKTAMKLQIGNLAGLANYDILPASPGYGLYSANAYLSGTVVCGGDKHITDDYSTTGITLAPDGSFHTPNFYVNVGGEIGLREVEDVYFATDVSFGGGMRIRGVRLQEEVTNADHGLYFNQYGYNNGSTRYRAIFMYNGQGDVVSEIGGGMTAAGTTWDKAIVNYGATILGDDLKVGADIGATPLYSMWVDVSTDRVAIGKGATAPNYGLDVEDDHASGFAGYFFNNGNDVNRYGIGIQCGEDTNAAPVNHPIRFYDGNGTYVSSVIYNSGSIGFVTISDESLKENIQDYSFNALSIIDNIQYRSFNWKKDKKKLEILGWVAQEVDKYYSSAVIKDNETGYKMVAKESFIPVLMEGTKALHKELKELQSRVQELELLLNV